MENKNIQKTTAEESSDIFAVAEDQDKKNAAIDYNAWMKDYLGKSKEYEIAKATLEREFIIPAVGNAAVDWVLDFSTATVTVTPREQTDD